MFRVQVQGSRFKANGLVWVRYLERLGDGSLVWELGVGGRGGGYPSTLKVQGSGFSQK